MTVNSIAETSSESNRTPSGAGLVIVISGGVVSRTTERVARGQRVRGVERVARIGGAQLHVDGAVAAAGRDRERPVGSDVVPGAGDVLSLRDPVRGGDPGVGEDRVVGARGERVPTSVMPPLVCVLPSRPSMATGASGSLASGLGASPSAGD